MSYDTSLDCLSADDITEQLLDDPNCRETLKEFAEGQLSKETLWDQLEAAVNLILVRARLSQKEDAEAAPYEDEHETFGGIGA